MWKTVENAKKTLKTCRKPWEKAKKNPYTNTRNKPMLNPNSYAITAAKNQWGIQTDRYLQVGTLRKSHPNTRETKEDCLEIPKENAKKTSFTNTRKTKENHVEKTKANIKNTPQKRQKKQRKTVWKIQRKCSENLLTNIRKYPRKTV